jgi:hypothetical protein
MNEEQGRRTKGEDKSKGKSGRWIIRLCVVQSAITSHLFMRRLDLPYKKRTPNPVQIFPKLIELGFRQVRDISLVFGSHRPQTTSDEDVPKRKFNCFDETNNFHVEHFSI